MNKFNFTLKATFLSVLFWLIESLIHNLFFLEDNFEIFPTDSNELWMRVVIVILVISFGIYADFQTKMLLKKEEEKRLIFKATIYSSQHITNNLLNQMQFFRMKADENNAFSSEVIKLYDQSLLEGQELMKLLSNVDDLTEENIRMSVSPKEPDTSPDLSV
ncbi:hypothetical protein [Photobacterium indicum]|jgi:hypothetical protein|uniref:Uncharacterized protein n=1 Tax=Photobacterium indicum TaxID=81447 RepID=A0A2T3L991_9GAMM|nr:hypothetical protein [Photobacterium indicum]PSV47554.1 hypothetical protein C9J47_11845 [Photobacterium indicum]